MGLLKIVLKFLLLFIQNKDFFIEISKCSIEFSSKSYVTGTNLMNIVIVYYAHNVMFLTYLFSWKNIICFSFQSVKTVKN